MSSMTMAERLAAAASGGSTNDGSSGNSIPAVESVSSESVAGKSKSGR